MTVRSCAFFSFLLFFFSSFFLLLISAKGANVALATLGSGLARAVDAFNQAAGDMFVEAALVAEMKRMGMDCFEDDDAEVVDEAEAEPSGDTTSQADDPILEGVDTTALCSDLAAMELDEESDTGSADMDINDGE